MADAGELKARATLDNVEFLKALKDMTNEVVKTSESSSKALEDISGGFASITDTVGGVVDAIGKVGALAGLTAFAKQALDCANATDKLYASFKALNGPTEETKKIFDEMSGLEMKSMFDFEDTLGPAAKHMMMLGMSGEDTSKAMKAVVDAAAGLKEGPEYIQAVTDAMALMSSHIVASQKDMKALQAQGIDAWGALAKEIGTSVPEAMEQVKKGMVSAQTVTQAVTKDLEKNFGGAAERSMDSWKGAMHILDETTEDAMVAIGRTIRNILNEAAPIIKVASDAVAEFANLWANLPGPLKDALIIVPLVVAGITAVTAAFGALQVVMAGMAFNPVVLGIAAVVAALALLGKWVYENWDAIKAVFSEGVDYLSKVFSPLINIWKAEWGVITGILSGAWDAIKQVFGWISEGIGNFIGWLGSTVGKIPGLGDEFKKLGAIWTDEQKKLDAAKQATDARNKSMDEAAAASAATRKEAMAAEQAELARANAAKVAAEEQKKREAAAKKAAEEQKKAAAEYDAWQKKLETSNDRLKDSEERLAATIAKANWNIQKETQKTVDIVVSNYERWGAASPMSTFLRVQDALKQLGVTSEATYNQAIRDAQRHAKVVEDAFLEGNASALDYQHALKAVQKREQELADFTNKELTDAYHQFGLKTSDEMAQMQKKSSEAYDKIVADAGADSLAAQQAWVKKTEETYANILAQGGTLTEAQKAELDKQKQQIEDHLKDTQSIWKTNYDAIKGIVSGTIDDLVNQLVTGDFSFGETMKKMFQDIASVAIHTFIDPLRDAVAKFIANELADLLSGKGLGGVMDSLKEIGKTAKDVFTSGGGGAASAVGGAPSAGAGAGGGGGAGGAGSAVSGGLTGWISAISGAVTAVSSIIGNFQQAKMETTLNAIEESTRRTLLYTGDRADGGIIKRLFDINDELHFGTLVKAMEKHRDQFFDWTGVITPIAEQTRNALWDMQPFLTNIDTSLTTVNATLLRIEAATVAEANRSLTVNVQPQGLTTAEAAKALGDQIARNLSKQLVAV